MAARARRLRSESRCKTGENNPPYNQHQGTGDCPGHQWGLALLENTVIELAPKDPEQAQSVHSGLAGHELVYVVQLSVLHLSVHSSLSTASVGGRHRLAYVTGSGSCSSCIPPGKAAENATGGYSGWSSIAREAGTCRPCRIVGHVRHVTIPDLSGSWHRTARQT